ncbi:PREDICTED: AP2-associated protein kinase 1-like isoform X2 [Tarenaya hassleriana]|uniref:AP2-associated protein kinase 1-like isoform X2 n=1 Tax=Tarenaya hassleriana TaxID=28532 RepID=UPI00053C0952|nr:PREDICTED: AP2-associated protein kinase 1-like isoform X2 [Tarenaya hassleriana]
MWKFKPFAQKEPAGLEGRYLDVGNLKIQVRNIIAEGGFSSVYLAQDATHASKQYALKHIICNDGESLELVMKEISVMKSLKGHPNVVTLYSHGILDMGRKKEALLVMEFCGKSLVSVLESRGSDYFEEKRVLSIFRDVCNAVFAMHCQSPPIAHRDLKAENLLLSSEGQWKLCDFGSISTNHKRFERAEEMGIEEDNIRKYTTPSYRAPEMWDLFMRELISEKVDIWALGCLLFRICYFKNAFDGESKLQILNGNYRIPDMPKYTSYVTDLIKDMLQASPDERPDITQVWFRVNEQLPANLQKSLPDRPPEMQSTEVHAGSSNFANKSSPVPLRSPPPPTSSSGETACGGQLGAFWSTQHAKNSLSMDGKIIPKSDELNRYSNTLKTERVRVESHHLHKNPSPVREARAAQRNSHPSNLIPATDRPKVSKDDAFNTFVAEFDTKKLDNGTGNGKSAKDETLEAEIERLKEQLKQANTEKAEMTAKFEKLSCICKTQRQELHELKQRLAAKTSASPSRDSPQIQISSGARSTLPEDRSDWASGNSAPKAWKAFSDEPKPGLQTASKGNNISNNQSVITRNSQPSKTASQGFDPWGFETDSFRAATTLSSSASAMQRPLGSDNNAPQPAGWAGF